MEYHSELMVYHLLYLYKELTGQEEINIDILRNAFYEFEANINEMNNGTQELDFDTEMGRILETYPYLFELFDNELSFAYSNHDEIEDILFKNIDDVTKIDQFMSDALNQDNIYQALEITAPIEEFKGLFIAGAAILPYYYILAHQELNHMNNETTRKIIKYQLDNLEKYIAQCDNKDRIKIRLCLNYYNEQFLKNEAYPNINSEWYILLLSKSKNQRNTLAYNIISSLMERDFDPEDEEDEEEYEEITSNVLIGETGYIGDELEIFLSTYLIYLHNYIKEVQDETTKKELTKVKYSMFSLGEVREIEEYFLEVGSLDSLRVPEIKKEWVSDKHFSFLIGNFESILESIRKKDQELSSSSKQDIIINLLILKCYLDLSVNETIKKELEAELANVNFYKNPEYSYLTAKTDEIIFNERFLNRARKKRQE